MKDLWMDPVVLGAGGVIVVGFVLLVVALRALRKSAKPSAVSEFDFPSLRTREPLSVLPADNNPFSANMVVPSPAPVANKDVLDKVDLISQRLVDMQMLLNKQVSAAAAHPGAASAGLSPEMLDKLLKIASTVAQQIDVLQKALGGGGSTPIAVVPAPPPADVPSAAVPIRPVSSIIPPAKP